MPGSASRDVGIDHALGVREIQPAHDADALGDRLVQAGELRIAGGRDQLAVELLVEPRHPRAVRQPLPGRDQPDLLQPGERGARIPRAELAHRLALQDQAHVVEVVQRREIKRPYAPAALGVHFQVALALQAEQRLAHRRARHARAAGNLVLGEACTGQQPKLEDVGLELLIDRPG
jgi:hypothetical protein